MSEGGVRTFDSHYDALEYNSERRLDNDPAEAHADSRPNDASSVCEPVTLTSSDPQPGWGVVVRDNLGRHWENTGGEEGSWRNWQQTDETQPDAETWTKVAGNYGPVTLVLEPVP